jgi:hypothetical protein
VHEEEEDESFERERRRTNLDKDVVRNSLESKMKWRWVLSVQRRVITGIVQLTLKVSVLGKIGLDSLQM